MKKNILLDIQVGNIKICFEDNNSHFKSIEIEQYKIFKDFKIDKLNRINIFAGFNNTGKTTLLESIYLLTKQNQIQTIIYDNEILADELSQNLEVQGW